MLYDSTIMQQPQGTGMDHSSRMNDNGTFWIVQYFLMLLHRVYNNIMDNPLNRAKGG